MILEVPFDDDDFGNADPAVKQANWDPSVRNKHLKTLAGNLLQHNNAIRSHQGGYNSRAALRLENQAQRRLEKACGNCILNDTCSLAYSLDKWRTKYPAGRRDTSELAMSADQFVATLSERPGRMC